jgi:hypothetical protein
MRKPTGIAVLAALNLLVAALSPVRVTAEAKKCDYDWAYDPLTHQPILVCVGCWFWSCDC